MYRSTILLCDLYSIIINIKKQVPVIEKSLRVIFFFIFFFGESSQFFELNKYKVEAGKDFKRIVFYLCKESELDECEDIRYDVDCSTKSGKQDQCENDEQLARKLEEEWNALDVDYEEFPDTSTSVSTIISATASTNTSTAAKASVSSATTTRTSTAGSAINDLQRSDVINTYEDVVKVLSTRANHSDQFFLVIRRMLPFSRALSQWQRQATKSHPTNVLRVRYAGEDGIDSGAIGLEFFENSAQEMGKVMFPDGKPIESTFPVQNGNFRTCRQIVSASLAQGGPPPCFLDESSYRSAFKEIDMMAISSDDLTAKENMMLEEVRADYTKYTDLIIDNNYTGVIDEDHIEEIIRSLKVSAVTRRSLYMKEFVIGLNCYGLADMIRKYPDKCQPLFVNGDLMKGVIPDADYLFSVMWPVYSEQGSSRKCIGMKMMDHFQDTLNAFEDEHMTGYLTAIAWRDFKDDSEDSEKEDEEKGKENQNHLRIPV